MMGESGIVRIDALVGFMALSPMIMNSGFSFILCVKIRSGPGKSQTSQACFRTRGAWENPNRRAVSTSASTRQGLPGTAPDLQGRRDQDRARGRQLVQVHSGWPARSGCCRASPSGRGKGCVKAWAWPASVPTPFGAPAHYVAPSRQERPADRDGRLACVRRRRRLRKAADRRAATSPCASAPSCPGAMRPCSASHCLDAPDGEQVVRVVARLGRHVDDAGRRHQLLHVYRFGSVVRVVLAGDPVDRRVEVRARVFAAGDVVPVPGRPALVEVRDLVQAERRALSVLRRQMMGVRACSVWLRSTTRTELLCRACARVFSMSMLLVLGERRRRGQQLAGVDAARIQRGLDGPHGGQLGRAAGMAEDAALLGADAVFGRH